MASDFSKKRVAVLGAGKMGGILLNALLEKQLFSSKTTVATVQHEEKARTLSNKLGIPVTTDNRAAARKADIILVCVKPQIVDQVVEQIRPSVTKNQIIVSAGCFRSDQPDRARFKARRSGGARHAQDALHCWMWDDRLVQGKVRDGSASGASASTLFAVVGRTVVVEEKLMDAVTGLLGAGGVHLHYFGIARGSGRESWLASRRSNAAGGANHIRRGDRGAAKPASIRHNSRTR